MPRVRNDATPAQAAKVLRANVEHLVEKNFASSDLDAVTESHLDLLKDLLYCTAAPTPGLLEAAAKIVFNKETAELRSLFAQRMCACISNARVKMKSVTSGSKLAPAVRELVQVLKSLQTPGLGAQLIERARKLQEASPRKGPGLKTAGLPLVEVKESPTASSTVPSPKDTASKKQLLSRAELWAKLGLGPAPASPPPKLPDEESIQDISSSQGSAQSPPPAASSSSSKPKPGLPYVDSARRCVVRRTTTGQVDMAVMRPGEGQFAMAAFEGEVEFESELPNLLLEAQAQAALKRPAARTKSTAKGSKKRKRASQAAQTGPSLEEDEEEEEEEIQELDCTWPKEVEEEPAEASPAVEVEEVEFEPSGRTYSKMRYPTGAFAIRQKQPPKSQLFQFKKKGAEEAALSSLADQVISKLEAGELSESMAKLWVAEQLEQL